MIIYILIITLFLVAFFAKGLLLSLISKILEWILDPINLILVIFLYYNKSNFLNSFNKYMLNDAYERDKFLHRNYRALWNISSSKGGTKFGKKNMTLSAMMGLKFKEKTLKGLLMIFYYLLYAIDFKKWNLEGHCINAYKKYSKQNENNITT